MPFATLFHDPTSEPSRAVHWFALEAGIDLDFKYTWLSRGEHRHPEFVRINPAHQVPVLKHGEFILPEAAAILCYLAELADCTGQWLGNSLLERAFTNRFLAWHHTNTRTRVTLDYVLPVLLMPAYRGDSPPSNEEIKVLRDRLGESLAVLNRFLVERGQFLGGANPSIADLFISVDLFALDIDPQQGQLIERFPEVQRWLNRLRTRDAYKISHAPWNAVVSRVKELPLKQSTSPREPSWVAEICRSANSR